MKEVIHFNSQDERLAYLKHGFDEIVPKKAKNAENQPENEKKSQNTAEKGKKSKKSVKKGAKQDEVQAE